MKFNLNRIYICECLKEIIVKEIDLGNSIRSYNEAPEWPKKDSRFIFLNNKLAPKSLVDIPLWIFVSVNNDMNYTWYNEYIVINIMIYWQLVICDFE